MFLLMFLQYVASYTAAEVHEIEIFLVQQSNKDVLRILEGHETLAELRAMYSITQHDMVSYLMSKIGMFSMQFPDHCNFWT